MTHPIEQQISQDSIDVNSNKRKREEGYFLASKKQSKAKGELKIECFKCRKTHSNECRKGLRLCYICGNEGHKNFNCPKVKCRNCGESGHVASRCLRDRGNNFNHSGPSSSSNPNISSNSGLEEKKARLRKMERGKDHISDKIGCRNCGRNHYGKCRLDTDLCFLCGSSGHLSYVCPKAKCNNCHELGHSKSRCSKAKMWKLWHDMTCVE